MINIGAFDVLNLIAADLRRNWSAGARAVVMIAEDPAHAMDIMRSVKPGTTCAILFYTTDSDMDQGCPGDTMVDATIRIAMVQHPGLKLADGRQAPTVLQAIDGLRQHVINGTYNELAGGHLEYRGMSYLATESGALIHGYALTYSAMYAYTV